MQKIKKTEFVSELLEKAGERTNPSQATKQASYAALATEWQMTVNARRRKKSLSWGAIAASLVLAVFVLQSEFHNPTHPVEPRNFGVIAKLAGNQVYRLKDDSSALQALSTEEMIVTGDQLIVENDSSLSILYGVTGDLRVNKHSTIKIEGRDEIRLVRGQIYYDSRPEGNSNTENNKLTVTTSQGTLTHHGTQFMMSVIEGRLSVLVREGYTEIESKHGSIRVEAGHSVSLVNEKLIARQIITSYGEEWHWIEPLAMQFDYDGQSLMKFLEWVGRETGRSVVFVDDIAEAQARSIILHGAVDLPPMQALAIRLKTSGLEYHSKDSKIVVSNIDNNLVE